MKRVVLGLGSNKSFKGRPPKQLLEEACTLLDSFIFRMHASSIYKTAPMYEISQNDFYNIVAVGFFDGSPEKLLKKVNEIEVLLGRNRMKEIRNGPRSMDIDIELFGTDIVHLENLVIPHEKLFERRFVLEPLVEVLRNYSDIYKEDVNYYEEKLMMLSGQRVEITGRLTREL